MKRFKIDVTKDDIKQGRALLKRRKEKGEEGAGTGDCSLPELCPIACALKRKFQVDSHVHWMYGSGWLPAGFARALNRKRVQSWVNAHDAGKRVEPFSFQIVVGDA